MANTISADLIQDVVIDTLNTTAATRLQMFKSGVTDFSDEAVVIKNGKPVNAKISLTTGSGETKTNPTTFTDKGNTIEAKDIAISLYSQQFGLDWNSGVKLEQVVQNNANKICDKLVSVYTALLTTAKFGASNDFDIAGATTADAKDNLFQEIFALLDKGDSKILIACSSLFAKGAPVNMNSFDPTTGGGRIRGFDGFYENAYLNTGTVKGVVTDGNGVGLISRVPEWNSKLWAAGLSSTNVTIENLGITVQFNTWADLSDRSEYGTFDVVFGAGVYDTSATKLIGQSAAQEPTE